MIETIKLAFKSMRVWVGTTGMALLVALIVLREDVIETLSIFVGEDTAITIMKVIALIVAVVTKVGLIHGATRAKANVLLKDR